MGEDIKIKLEPGQSYKHECVKTYFKLNLHELEAVYKKINKSLEVTSESWHRFINSKELFNIIHSLVSTMSKFGIEKIAHSEPIEWIGTEIKTGEMKTFHAMPTAIHNSMAKLDEEEGIVRYATLCFITMIGHFMFSHLYKKPFMISRGFAHTENVLVGIDDNLNYFIRE